MVRTPSILIAAGLALAGPAATAQQQPAFLMLRDPAGKPLEGAVGLVLPDQVPNLPALAAIGNVELFFTHQPPMIGSRPSRRTGSLKIGGDGAGAMQPGAVLLIANSTDGTPLSRLVPRLLPGGADKVKMPRAGLVHGPHGRTITLFPAALVDGERIVLPAMRGEDLPLPPGRYEAWVECEGEFTWQLIESEANGITAVAFDGPKRELQRGANEVVTPAGRADVVLLGPDRQSTVLRGAAAKAPLTARRTNTGAIVTGVEPEFPDWNTLALRPKFATAPDGPALGFALTRSPSNDWRVCGARQVDEKGVLRLPRVTGGDDWLLIVAPGHAPLAVSMVDVDPAKDLEVPTGTPLTVRCRLDNGDPAVDAVLEFVPQYREAGTILVRTDRRGNADLGPVSLPGTLRSSDPRYANTEQLIEAAPDDAVSFTVDRGFTVRGKVTLPDGKPASGVTVTLRAPRGALRPPQRSVVSGDDGSFAFAGLTENGDYAVFATTLRDSKTWSSRKHRFAASAEPLNVTIRNEDPELGPGRER